MLRRANAMNEIMNRRVNAVSMDHDRSGAAEKAGKRCGRTESDVGDSRPFRATRARV